MAEAKITLTLSPTEFDLVRHAVETDIRESHKNGNDSGSPEGRRKAKQRELQLVELQKKLQ